MSVVSMDLSADEANMINVMRAEAERKAEAERMAEVKRRAQEARKLREESDIMLVKGKT